MTAREILDKLRELGVNVDGITPDALESRISERIVLTKFDGEPGEDRPMETIVIEDGVVVSRTGEA